MSSPELLELTDKQKLDLLNTWNSRKDENYEIILLQYGLKSFPPQTELSKEVILLITKARNTMCQNHSKTKTNRFNQACNF